MSGSRLLASVVCAACLAASVVLVGVAGTVAVILIAWIRDGCPLHYSRPPMGGGL